MGVTKRRSIAIGEPYFKNRRVIAQSGTFVFPFDITRPVEEILAKTNGVMAKLVLPGPELRKRALRELYRMNITYATLFPVWTDWRAR